MIDRKEEISRNLSEIQREIAGSSPTLIVVTKTYPISDVAILHDLGVENFGENRNEEGLEKSAAVKARWHYQGEIQSKKLRSIASWADVIHSLDSLDHATKLSRILAESGGEIELFIQLSLDGNPDRGGVEMSELLAIAQAVSNMPELTLLGMMCVPPVDAPLEEAYSKIQLFHHRFKEEFPESSSLSTGMSGDYMTALKYGATHIRIGSKILGPRSYA